MNKQKNDVVSTGDVHGAIERYSGIKIVNNFIAKKEMVPFSQYKWVSTEIRDYVQSFRRAIIAYRGEKLIYFPWENKVGEVCASSVEFKELSAAGLEILDTIIYWAIIKNLNIHFEITTDLSIDGDSIVRFMSGWFEEGAWFPLTAEEERQDSVCIGVDDEEESIPFTWHFEKFSFPKK